MYYSSVVRKVGVGSYDIVIHFLLAGGIILGYLQNFYIDGGCQNEGHHYLLRKRIKHL